MSDAEGVGIAYHMELYNCKRKYAYVFKRFTKTHCWFLNI